MSIDIRTGNDVAREAYEESLFTGLVEELVSTRAELAHTQANLERMNQLNIRLARQGFQASDQFKTVAEELEATIDQSNRDKMTGLLNKESWKDIVSDMIDTGEKDFGILFIDLTNFKRVNDTIGHEKGDELIKKTALTLALALRADTNNVDLIAHERFVDPRDEHSTSRLGGDEFAVLCDLRARKDAKLAPHERMHAIEVRLRQLFNELLETEGDSVKDLGFDFAIGGSIYQSGMRIDELLARAEAAMYRNKLVQAYTFYEQRPLLKKLAHKVGRRLLSFAGTLDDRVH